MVRGVRRTAVAAMVGAAAARSAYRVLNTWRPGGSERWTRANNRGREVTLLEGPALAAGIAAAALVAPGLPGAVRVAGCGAALGAGAVGLYDDLNERGKAKGFRGHLGALAHGEFTTGAAKILGIGATGLAAGALVRRAPVDRALAGVVVAGAANVINLFDLRPGRATKAAIIGGVAGALRGNAFGAVTLGAAVALLPEDLRERTMLGDAGANALGAALGVATAAAASRGRLVAVAIGLVGLTVASERVSFTKVIAGTPVLRFVDELGRVSAGQGPVAVSSSGLESRDIEVVVEESSGSSVSGSELGSVSSSGSESRAVAAADVDSPNSSDSRPDLGPGFNSSVEDRSVPRPSGEMPNG